MEPHDPKELSVIICTRDRADALRPTLEALVPQLQRSDELIVVDNGSTDGTRAVVETFVGAGPNVVYVYEGRPGKCTARNAGLDRAGGRCIAFLDDDAVPYSDWRSVAVEAFDRLPADCGALTGQVIPEVEGGKPGWMTERDFNSLSSRVMKGDVAFALEGKPWLVTANALCKREALRAVGGFDPVFDLCGYAEDVDLAGRIKRGGYALYYYPALRVTHVLPASRFTHAGLIRRRYNGALGECLVRYNAAGRWGKAGLLVKNAVLRPVYLAAAYAMMGAGKAAGRESWASVAEARVARSKGYVRAMAFVLSPRRERPPLARRPQAREPFRHRSHHAFREEGAASLAADS